MEWFDLRQRRSVQANNALPASVRVPVAELAPARVERSFAEAPGIALADLLAAVLTGTLLWSRVAPAPLYAWVALHALLAVGALLLVRAWRADAAREEHATGWGRGFTVLGLLLGLAWAPAPIWMGPLGSDPLSVAAVTMLAGVPVLGAWMFRLYALGATGFVAGFLGCYVVQLLVFSQAPLRLQSAVALIAWGAILCVIGFRWQSTMLKLLGASIQRGRFIEGITLANALADSGLQARADFLSNMGHHLRTPLTVVLGMAKLLRIMPLEQEEMEAVEMIDRSGEELLGHINQLLDAAELVYGQVHLAHAEFDLRELVEKAGVRMKGAAQAKHLETEVRVAADVPTRVVGDEARLRDVLTNLCDNAVKFTPAGRVALSVERVKHYDMARRVVVEFSVSDTGIGIDSAHVPHVFEPFYQVEANAARQFRGAGLGLTIAHRLVQLMGGRISVKSALGEGSTFSFVVEFEIPAAEAPQG